MATLPLGRIITFSDKQTQRTLTTPYGRSRDDLLHLLFIHKSYILSLHAGDVVVVGQVAKPH